MRLVEMRSTQSPLSGRQWPAKASALSQRQEACRKPRGWVRRGDGLVHLPTAEAVAGSSHPAPAASP